MAAMKKRFEKYAHRLSESEQEFLWRQITNENQQEHRRRRQFWAALGASGALVTAALVMVVMLSGEDPQQKIERVALSPAARHELNADREAGGERSTERTTPTVAVEIEKMLAAAPAAPEDSLTVASSSVARRGAAADEGASETGLIMETVLVEGEPVPAKVQSQRVTPRKDTDALAPLAVDDISDALALKAGAMVESGQKYVRGGRDGEIPMQIDGVPGAEGIKDATPGSVQLSFGAAARDREPAEDAIGHRRGFRRHGCWIPPHWNEPNGEAFDAMYFKHYGTNPFIVTEEDALSTFAVDVDQASYTLMRRYLKEGELPPEDAVRVEEFVNSFDAGYGPVRGGDFALRVDGAPSPHGEGYYLLRLGLQARDISRRDRKPANLIFVIDTSGSMNRENRLGLVKRALFVLLDELDPNDTVGIVEYGSRGREVLRPTSLEDRRRIERAIESLHPNGSTNAEEGLDIAYAMASRIYDEAGINRIILCSDGVANTGETRAERILDRVRYESDRGIHLSTVGFGMGNYNDVLMETLADKGDGNYHYVDRIEEAERVFRENLTGTLQAVARDAKIQIEFDPERVLRWRLLGYENRDVADEDFRNDAVDAGEIGAGHTVTALYEVKLSDAAARSLDGRGDRGNREPHTLGHFRVRYVYPRGHARAGEVVELVQRIHTAQISRAFDRADVHFRLAALVAEYAEVLRGSYWARSSRLEDLVDAADGLARELDEDESARELARLIRRAARLESRAGRD